MDKIKMAPSFDEITIGDDIISTDYAGGIAYTAEGLTSIYKDEYLKAAFAQAIAFASKRWQVQQALNSFLHLYGEVSFGMDHDR